VNESQEGQGESSLCGGRFECPHHSPMRRSKGKVQFSPLQALEALRVVRG
jgi:hypothetical protein